MKLKGGYFFRALDVDLSTGEARVRDVGEDFAFKYIGGRGYGAKFVYDNLLRHDFKVNPLGPENLLAIAAGPLTGLYLPSSGKNSFVSISPATGIYGDSSIGGTFGVELRQAGWDALVVNGRAEHLSYLFIDGDNARIIRNDDLKGKTALQAEGIIKQEIGDANVKIAVIGPAGENGVVFACVNSEWGRNAGRTGIGAIMGSKNLKAIAVRGARDLPVADISMLKEISDRAYKTLSEHSLFEFWQQQGLMSVVDYVNTAGVMPTYNFRDGCFDRTERINGYEMESKYKIGDTACFACPISCGNACLVREGKYSGTVVEGPEFETACIFGSNLGVDNFACILKANQLCDELGVDTISTGNLIGAVIEGYESGLLSLDDVDGMTLHWGDEDNIIALIEKIARRDGIGDILAGGSKKVIEHWPAMAPLISQVKGLEQSAYDARVTISMALGYGTSDIGAHHTRAWTLAKELEMGLKWELDKKVDLVIYHQTIRPLFDMFGVCRLPWIELGLDERFYEELYHATVGIKRPLKELLERSNDIYNLTRIILNRLGISRKDDYPPERVFKTPVRSGPHAGKVIKMEDYERSLDIYYKKRGWSKEGFPPPEVEKEFKEKLLL